MGKYALVEGGVVKNIIEWEGPDASPVDFGNGVVAIEYDEKNLAGIGYTYKDGVFTAPPATEAEIKNQKEMERLNNSAAKEYLMSEASQKISVLQDAVNLCMATDEEGVALPLWKEYRVLLSRINADTSGIIAFPQKPGT